MIPELMNLIMMLGNLLFPTKSVLSAFNLPYGSSTNTTSHWDQQSILQAKSQLI